MGAGRPAAARIGICRHSSNLVGTNLESGNLFLDLSLLLASRMKVRVLGGKIAIYPLNYWCSSFISWRHGITGVDDTSGDDNEMDFGVDAIQPAVHRTNFYWPTIFR